MQQPKPRNDTIFRRIASGVIIAAILGAWGFASTRASNDDVKELEKKHKDDVAQVKKSLKTLETNSVRVCQFLDRQDRQNGGPGLQCKDPE